MIDLAPEHLAEVCRILREQVPECEVRAYGSRVTGRSWRFSDLDLVLVGPQGAIPWQQVERLKEAFACSDLPIMVDVQDWAGIGEKFRRIILTHHEIIALPRDESPSAIGGIP